MANAYSHIGLCVSDLDRSSQFYKEAFGFRSAFDFRSEGQETAKLLRLEPSMTLDAVYLWLDGLLLELLAFDKTAPGTVRAMNEPGLTHVSLLVDDIDAVLKAVVELGGRVRDDTNIGVAVFVEDPDNQAIELIGPGGPFRDLRARSLRTV